MLAPCSGIQVESEICSLGKPKTIPQIIITL